MLRALKHRINNKTYALTCLIFSHKKYVQSVGFWVTIGFLIPLGFLALIQLYLFCFDQFSILWGEPDHALFTWAFIGIKFCLFIFIHGLAIKVNKYWHSWTVSLRTFLETIPSQHAHWHIYHFGSLNHKDTNPNNKRSY